MFLLIVVSLVWAFSFGLIKGRLAGLDANAVAVVRLALALLVFLPWLRPRAVRPTTALWLLGVGAVQFGAMYALYLHAFHHLKAHEVALFTIFTPLYVAFFDATLSARWQPRHLAAAGLSVLAAGVLLWSKLNNPDFMTGFLLMQGSNLCFAAGQIAYQRTRPALGNKVTDAGLFGWLYLGATLVALLACVRIGGAEGGGFDLLGAWRGFHPTPDQWLVLAYLGVLASGVGFFLWNLGATRVNAGTLAVFNNAKIPLAVLCSLLFFGEDANLGRLAASLVLLGAALWLTERKKNPAKG
ncbi:MAG: EamA family transporter [Verrucomicrobiota bacterium]